MLAEMTDTQTTRFADLEEKIATNHATVAIVGLGYVGLPLALAFEEAGFPVVGIEIDAERCRALRDGRSYVADITDDVIQRAVGSNDLRVESTIAAVAEADAIIVCVPTPLRKTKDPDLTAILDAAEGIAKHLHPGQLIVLESTTYPGTTEEVLHPILSAGGLVVGDDYFLAFSPERIDPGNREYPLSSITKVVGGMTPSCTRLANSLYAKIIDRVVNVSNPRVAEAAKLLENTFRSINIGLANEMAIICRHLDIDVWEVIEAAATKPFGFMPHFPGPGLGGHCIPLDPHYLSWKARLAGYEPQLISVATHINGRMPHYVIELISDELNNQGKSVRNSKVLALGAAYKRNVSDTRESPAIEVIKRLIQLGACLTYSDPCVPELKIGGDILVSVDLSPPAIASADCVVVLTNHTAFDYAAVAEHAASIIDTRNAMRAYKCRGRVTYL
jgi:UDP-N-acetyl-D-glucosamine dehydrogenase